MLAFEGQVDYDAPVLPRNVINFNFVDKRFTGQMLHRSMLGLLLAIKTCTAAAQQHRAGRDFDF